MPVLYIERMKVTKVYQILFSGKNFQQQKRVFIALSVIHYMEYLITISNLCEIDYQEENSHRLKLIYNLI